MADESGQGHGEGMAAGGSEAPLEPWGRVVSGQAGVSATRIAETLGVTPALVRRLAQPVGQMKMQRCHPFEVYDPCLVDQLRDRLEVVESRERRAWRDGSAATLETGVGRPFPRARGAPRA